jgi:glycerol-3-phosphate dehydrogenase
VTAAALPVVPRRLRLNINLPGGGMDETEKIRAIVQPELGWDDKRWAKEESAYRALWERYYSPV